MEAVCTIADETCWSSFGHMISSCQWVPDSSVTLAPDTQAELSMIDLRVVKSSAKENEVRRKVDRRSPKLLVPSRNLLIGSLPQNQSNSLIAAARGINLKAREMLYEGGDAIDYNYFPIDCVIASLAILEDGSTVEIAMTGREGLVGMPALVGGGRALHFTSVAIPGAALKIPTSALEAQFKQNPALQSAVLRSYRGLFTQICQRSVCNVRHTLLERLCVWLLMVHDRVEDDVLPLTQEDIAGRISVRRAGVSVACSMLQSMHGIASRRGKIVILDRDTLEHVACECYQVMKSEFSASEGAGKTALEKSALSVRSADLTRPL